MTYNYFTIIVLLCLPLAFLPRARLIRSVSDRFRYFLLQTISFLDAFGDRTAAVNAVVKTMPTAIEKPLLYRFGDAHG